MKTLLLLDGAAELAAGSATDLAAVLARRRADFPEAETAVWDLGATPEGVLSIPAELERRLLPVRAELLAWVYETGRAVIAGRPLEAHLRAGDPLSMWWCSTLAEKHPKVTHNLFEALKLRVLEYVLEERGIRRVILLAPRTRETPPPHVRPSHVRPPHVRLDALAEVLAAFCAATGRSFERRALASDETPEGVAGAKAGIRQVRKGEEGGRPAPPLRERLKRLYYALPAPVQAAVRFPAWWWRVRRRLPRTCLSRPAVTDPISIVTYFPNIDMAAAREGRFRSRYWEGLHDALRPEAGQPHRVNWVFVHFPAPQCSFAEGVALRDRFRARGEDGASFHFLEEFLTTGDLFRAAWRYMRLFAAGLRVQRKVRRLFFLPGSRMDLWPYLKENWAESTRGWRALERCLMARAFRRYVEWAGPQAWLTFPQENCPWERMLAQAAHENGSGPVYGAQHSTVRPTDFRYFDDPRLIDDPSCRAAMPDLWLCNGTGARDALLAAGFPEGRTRVVEALRYLYLAAPGTGGDTVAADRNTPPADGIGPARRLLVVTSFFADETEAHLRLLAAAVRAGALNGWDIVVKPHPYLPVGERLRRLFSADSGESRPASQTPARPAPVPRTVEGPIGDFLLPGVVVWASNSTTVALEAAYRGLPVLVQAAENDVNLCPLQNMPGVVSVRSVKDVAAALAAPRAPDLPPDYLALDPALPRWRVLIEGASGLTSN